MSGEVPMSAAASPGPARVPATTISAGAALAQAVKEQEEGLLACVHCGFCLPACPTYRRLGDEADSPRGRLYLMQAVVEGRLDPGSDGFRTHIDRCLGCRACEPVCPSGVRYGHLLELARHVGREAKPASLFSRLVLRVLAAPWLARLAMLAARLLRATGSAALAVRLGPSASPPGRFRLGMAMLAASAPSRLPEPRPRPSAGPGTSGELAASARSRSPEPSPPGAAASVREGGAQERPPALLQPERPSPPPRAAVTVGVLLGCVQAGLFSRVNRATVRVLQANGYAVTPVPGQGCCGALHAHAGDLETARKMARKNVDAFTAAGVDYLAMNASGCGAAVAEYGTLLASDPDYARSAADVAARSRDVSQLLAERGPAPGAPVSLTATCDAPCHLLHAQGVETAPEAVLAAVAGLQALPLPNAAECCGGAGLYGITQKELGSRIGGDKAKSVLATGADAVLTANPGCMMQIGAMLRLDGRPLPVFHPLELLDESYRRAGRYHES